jgi:hypothetical protein
MKKLQKRSVTIALNIMAALGATYTITLPDGTKYSNTPEKPAKNSGRKFRDGRKYGDLAAHYRPVVDKMKPSDVVDIPCKNFNPNNLAGAISAWCCTKWGVGSVMTAASKTSVEVMRVK